MHMITYLALGRKQDPHRPALSVGLTQEILPMVMIGRVFLHPKTCLSIVIGSIARPGVENLTICSGSKANNPPSTALKSLAQAS